MKAKGFTKLDEPREEPKLGDWCEWIHNSCDSLAFDYVGCWVEDDGEFGDDRWVVECTGCGECGEVIE
jgi:hypothetical protein